MDVAKKIFSLALALGFGLLVGIFVVFNSVFSDSPFGFFDVAVIVLMVAVSYLFFGLVFGYALPEWSFVWGTVLALPGMIIWSCIISVSKICFGSSVLNFFWRPRQQSQGHISARASNNPPLMQTPPDKRIILCDLDGVLLIDGEQNKELLDFFRGLRARGIIVAIISNFSAPAGAALRLSDPELFAQLDAAYIAGEIRRYKPDPSSFLLPISEYELMPQQAIVIDDSKENIDAATHLGLDAIFFKTTSELIARLKEFFPHVAS